MTEIYDYFGVDIGDGESAVVWTRGDKKAEPQVLEVRGRKSLITALGVDTAGKRYIGEEAFQVMDIQSLRLRFKSRFLEKGEARRWMQDFARTLRESLENEEHIPDMARAKFYIGCPSGWDETARADYASLMREAGFGDVTIISESRAALIFAQESGELRIAGDLLHRPALIIDAGSSTTDYTYIESMQEQQISDEGAVRLGAGLIDALLLSYNIEQQEGLKEVLEKYPTLAAGCELEARKVKEMYFTAKHRGTAVAYPFESSKKLYVDPPRRVDIHCDDAIMEKLLRRPLEALGGQSYLEAYAQSLLEIKGRMQTAPPETILLTGGASRMPFIREIAKETFPDAVVIQGKEPEFAIARGLCYALRMEERRAAFLLEVDDMIRSDAVENVVAAELKSLFRAISPLIVDRIADDLAPEVFARWKSSAIVTLDDMLGDLSEQGGALMRSDAMREQLRPLTAQWLNTLRPQLEEITNPICDRYDLPRTTLMLPDFVYLGSDMPIDSDAVLGFSTIKFIIDVAVASVIAMLAGGGGVALVLSGPLGLIIGFIVGLVAIHFGTEYAGKLIMRANIPSALRRLFSRRLFQGRLRGKKKEMTGQLYAQLSDNVDNMTEDMQNMVNAIAQSIEQQLHAEMEKAVLLIR